MKLKLLSRVRLLVTPWTAAFQAPLSMRFSRQEYWSGCHCLLHWRSYKTSIQQAELETNFWPILHTWFQSFWSCFISIFLSPQNHKPLENGVQFLLTAISQVLSTLSGPKLMYTLNLLQVVRNKGRQIEILTNTCKLLWRKNWPPPPMSPLWLPWFCLTRSNNRYEKYYEVIFMVMLKMLNHTTNLQVIRLI